jgi:predicted ATPase/class 3 adenylate cyclase
LTDKPHKLTRFFREVWRRHVLQVALPYCVAGWLLIEVSEVVLQAFQAPSWVMQAVLIAFLVFLPIVLILAWIFDFTPAGLVRTRAIADAPEAGAAVVPEPTEIPALAVSLGESGRRQVSMLACAFEFQSTPETEDDPEFLRDAILALEEVFKDVTSRYQGYRLLSSAQALTLVFGYPVAHDDDARRAVAAGLALLEAAQRLDENHDGIPDLSVHIGVHTGEVVIDESPRDHESITVIGQVPRLASWLQTLAPPGSVVISPQTRELVQRHFHSTSLGLHSPAQSTSAWQVFQVSGAAQGLLQNRPPGSDWRSDWQPLGREAELLQLQARWQHAMDGDGQFVLVKGEPGIGKSSLVNTFVQGILETATAWVLQVPCSPYEQKTALYPVIQAVRGPVLRFAPDDSREVKLQKLQAFVELRCQEFPDALPLLAKLLSLPLPAGHPPLTGSAQQVRSRTLGLLMHIIRQQAKVRPFLLIIEDLLWADPTTLEWIQLVVEEGPSHGLFMLLTARTGFSASWMRRSYVLCMDLLPLPSRAAAELLRQTAGDVELPAPLIEHIVRETGGNPLYLHELTRAVLESGQWQNLPAGASRLELGWLEIPPTLKDSLAARVDHLGPAKALLQLCSIMGREFDYEQLRLVSGTENEVALKKELDTIVQSELLLKRGDSANPKFSFKHILIQETAYNSLLKSTRRELHLRAAKVVSEHYPDIPLTRPAMLAWHFAEAGESLKAVSLWAQAARLSLQSFANFEAINQAQSGLEEVALMPPSAQRSGLEIQLQSMLGMGLLATRGYAAPEVREAFTRAHELCEQAGDAPQLFQVVVGLWMFYLISARLDRALELCHTLVRTADASGDAGQFLQARYCLGYTLYYQGEFEAAKSHLEAAVASERAGVDYAAQSASGDDTRAHCRIVLAHLNFHLGYSQQALRNMDEALRLAHEEDNPFGIAFATFSAAWFHVVRREPQTALPLARAAADMANENGYTFFQSIARFMLVWAEGRRSAGDIEVRDPQVVEQLMDSVEQARANGSRVGHSFLLFTVAEDMLALGDHAAAGKVLESTWSEIQSSGEGFFAVEYYRLKGLCLSRAQAESAAAESCLRQAVELAERSHSRALGLRAAYDYGDLLAARGESAEAHGLLQAALANIPEKVASGDIKRAEAQLKSLVRSSSKNSRA